MLRAACIAALAVLVLATTGVAENYVVSGDMSSKLSYEIQQRISPDPGIRQMKFSCVIPKSSQSVTFEQEISGVKLEFVPPPQDRQEKIDRHGNRIITAVWEKPSGDATAKLAFEARTRTRLELLNTQSPFPLAAIPPDKTLFLQPTKQVQSQHSKITALSSKLIRDAATQFDAVQRTITWVINHLRYVNPPPKYDALFALKTGTGNCQNFSHLSAALLRAAGIPTRIVNGVTLDKAYHVARKEGPLTFKMAQGRHSWIEIWFPDLGWVPFDPQQTELFVSNRYIRVEIGVDNAETINDGLVRWSKTQGSRARLKMQETINAAFDDDRIVLRGKRQEYGPRGLLLCPQVSSNFKAVQLVKKVDLPRFSDQQLKGLRFLLPYIFGNLSFPINVDFAFPGEGIGQGKKQQITRSFLVESAEYVTGRATQYAQVFLLEKPILLEKISLALHNFGGDGMLWINLLKDHNGKPGKQIDASDLVELSSISIRPGYRWVDFDFKKKPTRLRPGYYWIALGFSGGPIVNWFYTYGKPVGPVEGTRYKGVFDEQWSGALSYEFNYRIMGKRPRD
ncbi:MAG: transglutaminase domain-containing protein [Desulfobacterales bacterium]|nr:transglutaminase domain-containing protein [Desulfobacterales bacterium]